MFQGGYGRSQLTRNIANADFGKLMDELTKSSPNARKGANKGEKGQSLANPEDLLLKKWTSKHSLGALQFLALVRTKLHEEEPAFTLN